VSRDAAGNELVIKRRPGRPRKVMPAPTAVEADYVRAVNEARDRHVDGDALVGALRGRADVDHILREIVLGLASESASISWETRQGRAAGQDTAQLSSRRIDALSKIGLVELARMKLRLGVDLAPSDPRTTRIVNFFVASVQGVLDETLPKAQAAALLGQIEGELHAWQRSDQRVDEGPTGPRG
jgi:hypothetical protein